jgi:hypothetical protein
MRLPKPHSTHNGTPFDQAALRKLLKDIAQNVLSNSNVQTPINIHIMMLVPQVVHDLEHRSA